MSKTNRHRNGTIFNDKGKLEEEYNKEGRIDARIAFANNQRMFKQNDFRCLKPISFIEPRKWPYYDMEGFRAAKSKKELQNVKVIKYDKYFFNFEDRGIFKKMMDIKRGQKKWRKTYGFDFVSFNNLRNQPVTDYECIKYCYKSERGKFARKCKKDGGLHKCCMERLVTFFIFNKTLQRDF